MPISFALLNIDVPDLAFERPESGKWLPHYNIQGYTGEWDVLTLRSPGGNAGNINAEAFGEADYADTIHMQSFPLIKKLMGRIKCKIMSARLLNLKAGAVIKQHRDFELAFEKGEARLHFPIITNDAVEFYIKNERIKMYSGQCWYINANLPHRVANYGTTDRIHLVVDCQVNDWLKNEFDKAQKSEFQVTNDEEQTLLMIQNLRLQQTVTANNIANRLERELAVRKEQSL